MNKKNKQAKGITLIALIITIVVLLILATVAVDVAIDGKLFSKADDAVNKTNEKVEHLQNRVHEIEDEIHETEEWASEKEMEKAIEVSLSFDPALTTWTNDKVEVTVDLGVAGDTAQITNNEGNEGLIKRLANTKENMNAQLVADINIADYYIEMSKDGKNWEKTNSMEYTENGKVYTRLMKNGKQIGEMNEGEVTNIDKEAPNVGKVEVYDEQNDSNPLAIFATNNDGLYVDTEERGSVYLNFVNGSDVGSGIKKTTFTVASSDGIGTYEYVFDSTTTTLPMIRIYLGEFEEVTSRIGSWTSEYTINVETIDNAGNSTTAEYTLESSGPDVQDV